MLVPTYEIKITYTCDSCGEEVVEEVIARQGDKVTTSCPNCKKRKMTRLPDSLFGT